MAHRPRDLRQGLLVPQQPDAPGDIDTAALLAGGVTAIGRVVFEEDPAVKMRLYNVMADRVKLRGEKRERFIGHMNTRGREVMRLLVDKYVTLHTGKVGKAMVS